MAERPQTSILWDFHVQSGLDRTLQQKNSKNIIFSSFDTSFIKMFNNEQGNKFLEFDIYALSNS